MLFEQKHLPVKVQPKLSSRKICSRTAAQDHSASTPQGNTQNWQAAPSLQNHKEHLKLGQACKKAAESGCVQRISI
jgi:hypothetical protein